MKIIAILWIFLSFAHAKTPTKELIKLNLSTFNQNNEKLLAVTFKNEPGWHTYWINPGDAGLPIQAEFTFNGNIEKLDQSEWPLPKRFIEKGDIITYGYEGSYTLFFKLPTSLDSDFTAHFKWLICHDICIPGEKKLSGKFSNGQLDIKNDYSMSAQQLQTIFEKLPKRKPIPSYLDINLVKEGEGLALITSVNKESNKFDRTNNLLTPYTMAPFSYKRETVYKGRKAQVFSHYTIDWDGEYMEPEIALPTDGKFDKEYILKFLFADPVVGETYIIEKSFNSFNLNAAAFTSFFKTLKVIPPSKGNTSAEKESLTPSATSESTSGAIIYFALMAFIGGLILNIMPCVLPVISLKLFGLIRHSGEGRMSIFKHNLTYSLGVMLTFLALAGIVSAFKMTGEQVGWGFQLQSPLFVAIMIVVIFVMALNLFGLFEFRTPGGSKLGGVELKDTFMGDLFSGVLATVLSTPCSAPFLGTALTFAFSESIATIFTIFIFIGLGLASPFIMTALFPTLIKFLPRPGMWMEHVKKILGFTLVLTTIWLIDVYSALTDSSVALLQMNTSLAVMFFLFYARAKISKNIILSLVLVFSSLGLFYQSATTKQIAGQVGSSLLKDKQREGLNWQPWSEQKMNELMAAKELTFIDFTAKWCLTCKVNEKLVLSSNSFKDLIAEKKAKLLLADWTKRDPIIGNWLKQNGFVGVPAYFVINSNGELIKLGETITVNELRKALK